MAPQRLPIELRIAAAITAKLDSISDQHERVLLRYARDRLAVEQQDGRVRARPPVMAILPVGKIAASRVDSALHMDVEDHSELVAHQLQASQRGGLGLRLLRQPARQGQDHS